MPNPSKILGHVWDKREDTLEIQVPAVPETEPVTKRSISSQLGKVYDPLGIISPTMLYVNNEFECFIRGSKHEKTV